MDISVGAELSGGQLVIFFIPLSFPDFSENDCFHRSVHRTKQHYVRPPLPGHELSRKARHHTLALSPLLSSGVEARPLLVLSA